jgi:parallel beta-helix repeat protein
MLILARSSGLPAAAAAAVLALTAAAADAATTLRVPDDHATITEAILASEWGDTILVGPGVYKESLVLSDTKGDGVILKSAEGPETTTIAYGDAAGNVNEAVVTFQRCTNSTQLLGFSIDGRGLARRGILVNSDSRPVLSNLRIGGAEYGIASHRGSFPYIENTQVTSSQTAALFVQGGSADVRGCSFSGGEKFGVYVRGTIDPMRLRDLVVENNVQVGLQATEGEFSLADSRFSNNGDSGMILQDVSPEITNVIVENHANVGIVMEACWGVLSGCTVRGNEYGMVVSIEGEPEIFNCTFQDNVSYHIGAEGDANPVIGGSLEHANTFLGQPAYLIQSSSTARVVATHNFWDQPCAPKESFQNTGSGRLIRKPWASGNLLREFEDCEQSRKYHNKWVNGKLDENGNPIGRDDDLLGAAAPAGAGG